MTASYGANGLTHDRREAFRKHGTKKVLIAYDRVEAGEKAASDRRARLTDFVLRMVREFAMRLDELHNDSTSLTFQGDYRQARTAARWRASPRTGSRLGTTKTSDPI